MNKSVRIVFEEDGFPRELVTAADRAAAVRADAIAPGSLVTVYRDNESPVVVEAGTLPELRPLFGIEEPVEESAAPADPPPAGPWSAVSAARPEPAEPVLAPSIVPFPRVPAPAQLTVVEAPRSPRRHRPDPPATAPQPGAERTAIEWAFNPIAQYAVFEGRAPVREYAGYWIVWLLAIAVAAVLGTTAVTLVALALALPSLAVMVRRLHDLNASGWIALVVLVPYIGALLLIVILLIPAASPARNNYGDSPLLARF